MSYPIPEAIQATQQRLRDLCSQASSLSEALEVFEHDHGIASKFDENLVLLDYDTLNVKWSEPYGYVCRGLILDPLNDWAVIAFGLPKFFNYGESQAAPIDWASARACEKFDGTMVQRYWNPYTGRFEYSTRFQLHRDLEKNKCSGLSDMTWLQLIERCLDVHAVWCSVPDWAPGGAPPPVRMRPGGISLQQQKDETWVFEVMSPLNRIVVAHTDFKAQIIARRVIDGANYPEMEDLLYPAVRANEGGLRRIDVGLYVEEASQVQAMANGLPGTACEGYVVVDKNFNRVKIKNLNYIQLHRLKDGINSVGAVINLAKSGDEEEVLVHFPEYSQAMKMAKDAIQEMVASHEAAYITLAHIPSQKEFALEVQRFVDSGAISVPSVLFLVRAGKHKSIRDAFMTMREQQFIDCVKAKLPKDFVGICMLPPTNPAPQGLG